MRPWASPPRRPPGSRAEEPGDANPALRRLVVVKAQRGRALESHLAGDRSLENGVGGPEPGARRLALGPVAEHTHVDARRAQVRAGLDRGHGHESDPRVVELACDRRADHLAHELVDPPHALGHCAATIAALASGANRGYRPGSANPAGN